MQPTEVGRRDVFIYTGPGTSPLAVRHTAASLRQLLPQHRLLSIGPQRLAKAEWATRAAVLVLPGGRASAYNQALAGPANAQIKEYVQSGGSYLGLCAGGYYAAQRVEFAVGEPGIEVVGSRPLGFFPGVCHGPLLPNFSYVTQWGTAAVRLQPQGAAVYYHGGGAFLEAQRYDTVEVMARYSLPPYGAAIVACQVGLGVAVLTGVHPEFMPRLPGTVQVFPGADAATRAALVGSERLRLCLLGDMLQALRLQPASAAGWARRRGPSSSGLR
jgi:biotin--protein ligase